MTVWNVPEDVGEELEEIREETGKSQKESFKQYMDSSREVIEEEYTIPPDETSNNLIVLKGEEK